MTTAADSMDTVFSPKRKSRRGGNIVVLFAFFLVVLVAMIAFAVDIGYVVLGRTQMQCAVDAGALAGAGALLDGSAVAEQTAYDYTQKNIVYSQKMEQQDIRVELGQWISSSRTFLAGADPPTAVRVFSQRTNLPLFFAPVMGTDSFNVEAAAIATYQPRDIVVVLDYSASMNDDSELRHINKPGLSQSAIEANLFQIYTELGSPSFGNMRWTPQYISSTDNRTILRTLGLDNVPYPYPSGSWYDYFNYVKGDSDVNNAGYRKKYGYLTLVNYWLERRPKANQTPDLWKTSQQPITAVKDAVTVFLAYLQTGSSDDQVGLSVYTADDGTAILEQGLTNNFARIETISRRRQAGHYDYYTNIGAGMQKAREELEENGRPGTLKMIVLMTDGKANRPSSTSAAKQFVLDEAQLAANDGYPVVTISLGADADQALMQQVADITGGIHFNIPGGQSVAEYEEDLKDVFKQIADHRPLKLVQ